MSVAASGTRPPRHTKRKNRKKGISAWVPNQHGAWAMLIAPAVLGVFGAAFAYDATTTPAWRAATTVIAILVAWFFGYFAFFAFGLVAKARTPQRKRQYLPPVLVYGAVAVVGAVWALAVQPQLMWWAVFFGPLVAVAVWETLQGRARSLISGVSTTVASALMVPVLVMAGMIAPLAQVPVVAWLCAAFLALYFSGTIPMVKTMIRERGNIRYVYGSLAYHAIALVTTAVLVTLVRPGAVAAGLMVLTMVLALARAWWLPASARRGRKWTAKAVGMAEIPLLLVACAAVISAYI